MTTWELEDILGEPQENLEEPIWVEKEETIEHTYNMAINRNECAFPIRETNGDASMKTISPSTLPHLHGLTSEDPDTFLLDFVVICRTYDYTSDDQKLKLFPSTLKDVTLR